MTIQKLPKKGHQGEDLRALKVAFVTWLLDPSKKGNQEGWAERHGVNDATLSTWKQDEFVLGLLGAATKMMEPVWAQALAALAKIATDPDHINCVSAVRELGKLMSKYPSEKVDLSVIERVAYTDPGALVRVSSEAAPEARPN